MCSTWGTCLWDVDWCLRSDGVPDSRLQAKHGRQSGIVYCLSQKETQDVAGGLRDRGINAQVGRLLRSPRQ